MSYGLGIAIVVLVTVRNVILQMSGAVMSTMTPYLNSKRFIVGLHSQRSTFCRIAAEIEGFGIGSLLSIFMIAQP